MLICADDGATCEIRLEGVVNIAMAAELKSLLLQAAARPGALRICLDQVTELDVCAMQLLSAAEREWRQNAMPLAFIGPLQAGVSASLAEAGFPMLQLTEVEARLSEV